jgi:endonuclease G, mitochondrial
MDDHASDRLDPRLAWQIRLLWIATITLLWLFANRGAFGDDTAAALPHATRDNGVPIVVGASNVDPPRVASGNVLLITPLYVASLNPETKLADWVQYTLTPGLLDTGNVLSRNWRTGLNAIALESADYDNSGYDRGHLVPLASVAASPYAAWANRMEVVAPQTPQLNRGVWLKLEDHARELVAEHGEVTAQAGTLYEDPAPPLAEADEPHQVPSHYWLRLVYKGGVECYIVPQSAPLEALPDQYALDEKTLRGRVKPLR